MFEKYLDDLPGSRLQILEYIRRNSYISAAKLKEEFVPANAGNYYEHSLIETLNFFLSSGFIRITPYKTTLEDNLYHEPRSDTDEVANYPMKKIDELKAEYHCCILPKGADIVDNHLFLIRQLESLEHIASETQKQSDSAKSQAASASETVNVLKEQVEYAKETAEDSKKDARFAKIMSVLAIFVAVLVPFIDHTLDRFFPW